MGSPAPSVASLFSLVALACLAAACGPADSGATRETTSAAVPTTTAGADAQTVRLRYFDVRDLLASHVAPEDEVKGVAQGFVAGGGSVEMKNGILIGRGPTSGLDAIQKYLETLREKAGGASGAPRGSPPVYTATTPAAGAK